MTRTLLARTIVFAVGVALLACSKRDGAAPGPGADAAANVGSSGGAVAARVASDGKQAPPTSVAHAHAFAPRCEVDQVPQRIRGRPRLDAGLRAPCPASPAQLDVSPGQSPDWSQLYSFDHDAAFEGDLAHKGYPGFVYEFDLNEGRVDVPRDCHYVGCTKLIVGDQGVTPATGRESCLGPLPGGTSKPASLLVRACPRAVQIGGELRPFTRVRDDGPHGDGGGPACCYSIPAPIPP